jgi:hypothetical protein
LIEFSLELNPDIAAFNVAAPAWNTTFREEVVGAGWDREQQIEIAGDASYPVWETPDLSRAEIWRYRSRALRRFYLRPSYILRQLLHTRTPYQLYTFTREGVSMLATALRS